MRLGYQAFGGREGKAKNPKLPSVKNQLLFAAAAISIFGCNKPQIDIPPKTVIVTIESHASTAPDEPIGDGTGKNDKTVYPFFSFKAIEGRPPDVACRGFPEIELWAEKRNLNPLLVRAIVLTESGFEPGLAKKVCRWGFDAPDCRDAGPDEDDGYLLGHAQMHDPDRKYSFKNAPNSKASSPDWRWLYSGLMQTPQPPHTFWPMTHSPDGKEGQYKDMAGYAGMTQEDLDEAKSCDPLFNPFIPADSICVGTLRLERKIAEAKEWIASNRSRLNWDTSLETGKTEIFTAYVAVNMYSGLWESTRRAPDSPDCTVDMQNGDCWARGFYASWKVDETFCLKFENKSDARCENNRPKRKPPDDCYGETDFVRYVRDCKAPHLPGQSDDGKKALEAYLWLEKNCK